jgi:hypothetical protein
MLRDEAVNQIKRILGYNTSTAIAADIEETLRFIQNELEHDPELPYFLKEEVTNLVTVASTERLAPPDGFIRIWDEDALYLLEPNSDPATWHQLEKDEPKYLRQSLQGRGEAQPVAYAWDGTDFLLFPTPDTVYTLRLIFYKADAVLSSNITNKWLTHLPYLMIAKTGMILSASLRDQSATAVFQGMLQTETVRLNSMTVDRDGSGRKLVVGGPD